LDITAAPQATKEGPLSGVTVLELAGVGPLPFAAMMLADLGADVIRIDRPTHVGSVPRDAIEASQAGLDHMIRGRRRIALDLKDNDGVETLLRFARQSDVFLEGFRPGVAERLGVGPERLREINPRIIYGRVSGWGRSGPLAHSAGHDVNYIALAGVVHTLQPRGGGVPVNPVGHIGDFGGGGMLLAFGILAGLHERVRSGLGQVVDSSILDGGVALNTLARYLALNDASSGPPGTNMLDGGSHFFGAYECQDGKFVVFGALEAQFHDLMLKGLGIDPSGVDQFDRAQWSALRRRVATIIKSRTRAHWESVFEGTDACFSPVLDHDEVHLHPHHQSRQSFVEVDGQFQAAPAPRFSRTPPNDPLPTREVGVDAEAILEEFGFSEQEITGLIQGGSVRVGVRAGGHS
jgi:alpha-methylacyl-CoA racemase